MRVFSKQLGLWIGDDVRRDGPHGSTIAPHRPMVKIEKRFNGKWALVEVKFRDGQLCVIKEFDTEPAAERAARAYYTVDVAPEADDLDDAN